LHPRPAPPANTSAHSLGIAADQGPGILIGKATGTGVRRQVHQCASLNLGAFKNNWPCVDLQLAEAIQHQEESDPVKTNVTLTHAALARWVGDSLGGIPLGCSLVTSNSLLSLQPALGTEGGDKYALKDFVKYALGTNG